MHSANELILGIELKAEYAQVTYFHQSVKEPVTLKTADGSGQLNLPMAIGKNAADAWVLWDESCTGDPVITDVFGKVCRMESCVVQGEDYTPVQLLSLYFSLCLDQLKVITPNAQIHVMVTVRALTEQLSQTIVEALQAVNIERRRIYLQDYHSAFYYYTINQKREYWYHDVALLEYVEEGIEGFILHIDRTKRPAVASVEKVAVQKLDEKVRASRNEQDWKKEKDRLFFELLKKLFERRNVSVSYLVGDYFSKDWAQRSFQYLCHKRHAFQGENLYSKGACYAAMERAGLLSGQEILFYGSDMVDVNIGMEMRVRGKETFYPIINAGINWYEAHAVLEFILNDETEVRLTSAPIEEGDSVVHILRLPQLPKRPARATRMRLTVYFTSASKCVMEAEDLGFGGFYRSSGLSWKREISF